MNKITYTETPHKPKLIMELNKNKNIKINVKETRKKRKMGQKQVRQINIQQIVRYRPSHINN